MLRRKLISLAAALLLTVGAYAPTIARGDRLPDETTSTAVAGANTQSDAQSAAQPAAKPKRQGGGFGRALSAPFRALARLFGGGKKDAKQSAAKTAEKQEATASVKTQVALPPASKKDEKRAAVTSESAPVSTAQPPASRPSTNPAETTRVVRPAEERLAPRPGTWVPVIEGIPKDPLSQGRALLQHGYLNEAVSELSIAATRGDNLVEANNLLGLAYDRLGWRREAIAAYERARSVAPNDAVVLANLGYSYYLDSNYAASLKRLKQAARLSPATPLIHEYLGIVQAGAGKFDDAFKSFARAGGAYDAHVKIASILETAKRDRDAAKHYEAALRLQPGTSALLERLVALYERNGQRTKADTARRTLGQPKNEQKTTTGGGG